MMTNPKLSGNESAQKTRIVREKVPSNNETVSIYDDRTIAHDYDGFPAQGRVVRDVVGFEILDEVEPFRDEARSDVEKALFGGFPAGIEREVSLVEQSGSTFTFEVLVEAWEYTVEVETENRRRIR